MNVAATVPQLEANPQLSLPTGPFTSLRGGRRDRTDEDREWHSEQSKVAAAIKNVHHREVYRQLAFLGSCNPGRLCFAAHSTIAREKKISTKTVQRAVKYFESEGLIRCISVGAGRSTGKYQILGRSKSPASVPQRVPAAWTKSPPNRGGNRTK